MFRHRGDFNLVAYREKQEARKRALGLARRVYCGAVQVFESWDTGRVYVRLEGAVVAAYYFGNWMAGDSPPTRAKRLRGQGWPQRVNRTKTEAWNELARQLQIMLDSFDA